MKGGIDFLVTDLQMPVCSGLELLERLEAAPGYQRPGTILCTAKGLELDSETIAKRYGLAEIMHKPFSPRKLVEAIERHLDVGSESAASVDSNVLGNTPMPRLSPANRVMEPNNHA